MNKLAVDVVKRQGKRPNEAFDPGKLYASVYAVCISSGSPDGLAHDAADEAGLKAWIQQQPYGSRLLAAYNSPQAAVDRKSVV